MGDFTLVLGWNGSLLLLELVFNIKDFLFRCLVDLRQTTLLMNVVTHGTRIKSSF